jgi:hypothetical protein
MSFETDRMDDLSGAAARDADRSTRGLAHPLADREDLPAARELLGSGAEDLLREAVAVEGATLVGCEHSQVLHRSGCLAVCYSIELVDRAGRRHRDMLVAVADRSGPPEGSLVLEAGDLRVGVFRFPFDPDLPGLAVAVDPSAAAALVGVEGRVTVSVRKYLPRQRAVIRLSADNGQCWWVKVLAVDDAVATWERHRSVARVVPSPEVLGVDHEQGLLVLSHVAGRPLREVLTDPGSVRPAAEELLGLLARLGGAELDVAVGRPSRIAAAPVAAALLAYVRPDLTDRLGAILGAVGPDSVVAPEVVIHGDLHPGQLITGDGHFTGLLDFDDAGLGQPVDDLARYLAHLVVLAADSGCAETAAYLQHTTSVFSSTVDPIELQRRVAAALITLAAAPYCSNQDGWDEATERRIALAEVWCMV